MRRADSHLSDEQILLTIEGEARGPEALEARAHIDACWKCRARRRELEAAAADYVRVHHDRWDGQLPEAAAPRALLKAQMERAAAESNGGTVSLPAAAVIAAGVILVVGLLWVQPKTGRHYGAGSREMVVSTPDPRLTPGATLLVNRLSVCSAANVKNKAVPAALQRKVFEEYGITGAEPRAYEVDYLVTPALGGADDIHNLWPHSYTATVWNAQVKDALEDRLHELVCEGSIELSEAQREIAANWIDAYKKYFHTDRPLAEHWRPGSR